MKKPIELRKFLLAQDNLLLIIDLLYVVIVVVAITASFLL